ncbi:MAG TPA: homoserine kinase [Jiangellales bacterium]|nr:homoserine kinase [Jiangellales bacterium]
MAVPAAAAQPVRVRVPATSANLGPGYDSLGLALGMHDEVEVRPLAEPGTTVVVEGEGAAGLPCDESHLVVQAMRVALDRLGGGPPGLSLRCRNRIPHGRGLGSSAGAIVAGVVAARALVHDGAARLDDVAALEIAGALEGHPDNVAPCLLGGATVAWTDAGRSRAVRLEVHPEVAVVVAVPEQRLGTREARALLPDRVTHPDAAANAARAALLVHALTRRPDLLLTATEDRLHQEYRRTAMPASLALVDRLRAAGLGAVVSGAGPSVLVLTDRPGADQAAALVGSGWAVLRPGIEPAGATVEPVDGA